MTFTAPHYDLKCPEVPFFPAKNVDGSSHLAEENSVKTWKPPNHKCVQLCINYALKTKFWITWQICGRERILCSATLPLPLLVWDLLMSHFYFCVSSFSILKQQTPIKTELVLFQNLQKKRPLKTPKTWLGSQRKAQKGFWGEEQDGRIDIALASSFTWDVNPGFSPCFWLRTYGTRFDLINFDLWMMPTSNVDPFANCFAFNFTFDMVSATCRKLLIFC